MKLQICNKIKEILPDFTVSAYTFTLNEVNTADNLSADITDAFKKLTINYQAQFNIEDVVNIKRIKITRDGYKQLGKDPSHTRPACEALLRRILKNGEIFRLGNVIDIGNLLSLALLKSVCVVDLDKLQGDIFIRIGNKEDEYYGINRGKINVDKIPLYTDNIGPFGNPTSDTLRTAVTSNTKNIFIMVIHFNKDSIIEDDIVTEQMIKTYLKIDNFKKIYI